MFELSFSELAFVGGGGDDLGLGKRDLLKQPTYEEIAAQKENQRWSAPVDSGTADTYYIKPTYNKSNDEIGIETGGTFKDASIWVSNYMSGISNYISGFFGSIGKAISTAWHWVCSLFN